MEENDWQAKEHVGNKCEMDVTERRRQNSYVMLLGFLHLCGRDMIVVYMMPSDTFTLSDS